MKSNKIKFSNRKNDSLHKCSVERAIYRVSLFFQSLCELLPPGGIHRHLSLLAFPLKLLCQFKPNLVLTHFCFIYELSNSLCKIITLTKNKNLFKWSKYHLTTLKNLQLCYDVGVSSTSLSP